MNLEAKILVNVGEYKRLQEIERLYYEKGSNLQHGKGDDQILCSKCNEKMDETVEQKGDGGREDRIDLVHQIQKNMHPGSKQETIPPITVPALPNEDTCPPHPPSSEKRSF